MPHHDQAHFQGQQEPPDPWGLPSHEEVQERWPEEPGGRWEDQELEEEEEAEAIGLPAGQGREAVPSEPAGIRPGPLSQALAAAQSVIGSLGRPPSPDHQAEPTPRQSPEGPGPPTSDLPEEPPPWMIEEEEDGPGYRPEAEVEVEEVVEEEIVVHVPEHASVEDLREDLMTTDLGDDWPEGRDEAVALEDQDSADQEATEEAEAPEKGREHETMHEKVVDESEGDEENTTPSAYGQLAAASDREPDSPGWGADAGAVTQKDLPTREQRAREEPAAQEAVASPALEWGALWRESAQGWVEDEEGRATWRPIVATTPFLSDWEVDTYLGVVAGEAVLGPQAGKDLATGIRDLVRGRGPGYEKEIAQGRSAAIRAMVEDAVARGAHAVVAVKVDYESVAGTLLVTATGTAVTLKSRG